MKKIKLKIFKILIITSLLSPTVFFQVACQQKDNKLPEEEDVKNETSNELEKEINILKVKISDLEETKNRLVKRLKPVDELMIEHNVDNFDALMGKLLDVNDSKLLEKSLVFANCLLETETMTLENLQSKLEDEQWKDKNKDVLKTLSAPFNLKWENFTSDFNIDSKVVSLAEKISRINDSSYIKKMRIKIDEYKEKLKKNEKQLISCYLAQLADEKYIDWENFVKQFNDQAWKNDKKNKPTIENLLPLLNCSIEDLDANKINDLDEEIIGAAREFIKKRKDIMDGLKSKISKLESELKTLKNNKNNDKDWDNLQNENVTLEQELETKKKELDEKTKQYDKVKSESISYYLFQLWDEKYANFHDFVKNFDNLEWKNGIKKLPIIEKIAQKLNCSIKDLNANKINSLDAEVKSNAEQLMFELHSKFSLLTDNLIAYYLALLWDGNYVSWISFTKQFDNEEWKNDKKNLEVIKELSRLFNCSFEQLNSNKIFDSVARRHGQQKVWELLDHHQEIVNGMRKEFESEKEQLIEDNNALSGSIDLLNNDLNQAQHDNEIFKDLLKEYDVENIVDLKKKYDNMFDKNKKIETFSVLIKNGINALQVFKDEPEFTNISYEELQREFLSKSYEDFDTKIKDSLIIYSLCQLKEKPIDTEYTWEDFAQKFDNKDWKISNPHLIDILAWALGKNFDAINKVSINKILSEKIKDAVNNCPPYDVTPESDYTNYITSYRDQAIGHVLAKVWAISIDDWKTFLPRFNSPYWRDKHPDVVSFQSLFNIPALLSKSIKKKVDDITEEMVQAKNSLQLDDRRLRIKSDIWDLLIFFRVVDIKSLIHALNLCLDILQSLDGKNDVLNRAETLTRKLCEDLVSFNTNLLDHDVSETYENSWGKDRFKK